MIERLLRTDTSPGTILIRILVGTVFLSEGIQKFLFSEDLGSGRFAKIGLLNPEFLGLFVGTTEILCGTLILLGLVTRLAAIPLITIMLVALTTTKFRLLAEDGFWSMLHASRTDWSMLMGCLFLILKGGGKWSLDKLIWKNLPNQEV